MVSGALLELCVELKVFADVELNEGLCPAADVGVEGALSSGEFGELGSCSFVFFFLRNPRVGMRIQLIKMQVFQVAWSYYGSMRGICLWQAEDEAGFLGKGTMAEARIPPIGAPMDRNGNTAGRDLKHIFRRASWRDQTLARQCTPAIGVLGPLDAPIIKIRRFSSGRGEP